MRLFAFLSISIAVASLAWAGLDPARLSAAGDNAPTLAAFAEEATKDFGDAGAKAAAFLVAGMPDGDLHSLSKQFLMENLRLALQTRDGYPWSKQVSEGLLQHGERVRR
ncbi:MAG: hypothetical protein WCP35_07015 [Verrucomicrobiota bacterium]